MIQGFGIVKKIFFQVGSCMLTLYGIYHQSRYQRPSFSRYFWLVHGYIFTLDEQGFALLDFVTLTGYEQCSLRIEIERARKSFTRAFLVSVFWYQIKGHTQPFLEREILQKQCLLCIFSFLFKHLISASLGINLLAFCWSLFDQSVIFLYFKYR